MIKIPFEIQIIPENCTGCRICQLWCSYIHKKIFSISQASIQITEVYEVQPQISFLDSCNKCGQCADHCLYGALQKIKEGKVK